MPLGKKNENPTRKTGSKNFTILQVEENKNSDWGFVNTKLLKMVSHSIVSVVTELGSSWPS